MIKTLTYKIHQVVPYINWIYFFHAWGFPPRFASIAALHGCDACKASWLVSFNQSERPKAEAAMQLYKEATRMLNELDNDFGTVVRFGLFPAYSDGDDLILLQSSKNKAPLLRLPLLRQQAATRPGQPYLCLADFVQPIHQGTPDTVGVFAGTVDREIEQLYQTPPFADDYKHMLAQTLADRLAEASVEKMHEEVRKTYWAYAPQENLSMQDLLLEKYQGIRPAVGYPSLPDQTLNFELDQCLGFKEIGIHLTENGAMIPHASVSGLMLAHPAAHYFAIGKIGEDQLHDYAMRKGYPVNVLRKFLLANLNINN